MNINNKYAPWVRMIMSDDTPGGAATDDASAPTTGAQSPEAGAQSADHDQESGSDDSDDDYGTNGRGSKRAVLADLVRERHELCKQLDEINRSKMTEQEKLQADVEAGRKRSAEMEGELTTSRQQAWAREALASVGLPAEMADRPWRKHVIRPTVFTLWV